MEPLTGPAGWRPVGYTTQASAADNAQTDIQEDIDELQADIVWGANIPNSGQWVIRPNAHVQPAERLKHRHLSNLAREYNDLTPLRMEEQLRPEDWSHSVAGLPVDVGGDLNWDSYVTKDAMLAYRAAAIGRSLAQEDVHEDEHRAANAGWGEITGYDVPVPLPRTSGHNDFYPLTRPRNTKLSSRVKKIQQDSLSKLARDMAGVTEGAD